MEWNIKIPFQREINERFIEVQKTIENGVQCGKFYVTPAELVEAICQFTTNANKFDLQPLLPKNCIHFTKTPDNKTFQLIISSPKGERLVKYQNNECFFIEVPKTLMVIILKKNDGLYKLTESRLFAIKDEAITTNTALHAYPFPNVEKSLGTICWGGNQFNQLPCLTSLNRIVDAFYEAPFGEDYGMRLLSGYPSFKKYLVDNEGKPFLENDLSPTGQVLGDLI